MDDIITDFWQARSNHDGLALARTLTLDSPPDDPNRLRRFAQSTNAQSVDADIRDRITYSRQGRCKKQEADGWMNIYIAYWKAISELNGIENDYSKSSWSSLYEAWNQVVLAIYRGFSNFGFEHWTLPILEIGAKKLRELALKADKERSKTQQNTADTAFGDTFDDFDLEMENKTLEDCARQLNKLFTLCLSDRAELEKSRKWSIYMIINLLFKTYFRLNKADLSRNLVRALQAYRGDMPDLYSFKLSQVVTFQYYQGVLEFLEENYVKAEEHLKEAYLMCHKDHRRNKERILSYYIPCHLLTSHQLPSESLLASYPALWSMFHKLGQAIKRGDLKSFDTALQTHEDEFIRRRIYLTLERGRDIALRNLLRKVFIAGGFDEPKSPGDKPIRRTRVPVAEFQAAIAYSNGVASVDTDEVECMLANMIYKNLMKGYIARERGIVVLSKAGAFPGTGV